METSDITLFAFKKNLIEHNKILKDIDYGFSGRDITFLKNLVEYFNFVFKCRFSRMKFSV